MVYRIRYRSAGRRESEAEVEANSPTEALVKFCHVRGLRENARDACSITGVPDEQTVDDTAW